MCPSVYKIINIRVYHTHTQHTHWSCMMMNVRAVLVVLTTHSNDDDNAALPHNARPTTTGLSARSCLRTRMPSCVVFFLLSLRRWYVEYFLLTSIYIYICDVSVFFRCCLFVCRVRARIMYTRWHKSDDDYDECRSFFCEECIRWRHLLLKG